MNLVSLSWRYAWHRPVSVVLNVLLLAVGVAALTVILLTQQRLTEALTRDVAGTDLVVGAKGSPLQLILAGLYHLDVPPGNIPLADAKALMQRPEVAEWVPLSLGDSVGGHRIVGTTPAYLDWYGARLGSGTVWRAPMQAVLGARVAQDLGLALGSHFTGQHGLAAGGHEHGNHPYEVVGILAPTGGVIDGLVLTATESVWAVHEDDTALDDEDRAALEAERELTLLLIRYRSPLAAVSFPRWVNAETNLQAAAPALELTRLLRLLGVGTDVLRLLGTALLGMAGLSVFMALWQAVRERRADLALLRMLGVPPWRLAGLLLTESLWLAVLGGVLGVLGGWGATVAVAQWLAADASALVLGGVPWAVLWPVPVLVLGVAVLAAALPAWSAYRSDVVPLLDA